MREFRAHQTLFQLAAGPGTTRAPSTRETVVLHHAHDLVERLDIAHCVVDGIVVMGCPSEPHPALGLTPISVEARPEVTDAPARVPEWISDSSAIEQSGDPLPVIGGIVADKDRLPAAQVLLEPCRESLRDAGAF